MLTQKLFADVTLTLLDTTSVHFEGSGPRSLAACGYSPTRPDLVQVRLRLLTSREGLPLSHGVFPGNLTDLESFAKASRHFQSQLPVGQVIVVADRGMVSDENLRALEQAKIPYIVGVRLRWHAEKQALARARRYRKVRPNGFVKAVHREEGRRVLVCHNPEEVTEDRRQLEAVVARLEQALAQGPWAGKQVHKGPARRYLLTQGARLQLDWARIRDAAVYAGKWVLWTTTRSSPEEVPLAYKGLLEVGGASARSRRAWRSSPSTTGRSRGCAATSPARCWRSCWRGSSSSAWRRTACPSGPTERWPPLSDVDEVELVIGRHRLYRMRRLTEEQQQLLQALQVPLPPAVRLALVTTRLREPPGHSGRKGCAALFRSRERVDGSGRRGPTGRSSGGVLRFETSDCRISVGARQNQAGTGAGAHKCSTQDRGGMGHWLHGLGRQAAGGPVVWGSVGSRGLRRQAEMARGAAVRRATGSQWIGGALLAIFALTLGTAPGLSQPWAVPVAPNDSLVIGQVLGYCVLDSSLLDITPKQVLYSLTLLVVESMDVPDMLNFTKTQIGKVIRAYSREPIGAELFETTIQARVRFEGDERGGNFWIRDIQVLGTPLSTGGTGW